MPDKVIAGDVRNKVCQNFTLTEREKDIVDHILTFDLNYDRISVILDFIIELQLDKASVMAFLTYQLYKFFSGRW